MCILVPIYGRQLTNDTYSPERLDSMIQKSTLLLICINADIAEIVAAFVREQLSCEATIKHFMVQLVQDTQAVLQLFNAVADVQTGVKDRRSVMPYQNDSLVNV